MSVLFLIRILTRTLITVNVYNLFLKNQFPRCRFRLNHATQSCANFPSDYDLGFQLLSPFDQPLTSATCIFEDCV